MDSFASLYPRAWLRPRAAFAALLEHPARTRFGFGALAITAVTYQLVYLFLARNGGRPTVFTPWLAVPPDQYYAFNQWVVVPSIILAWVSASGFTQLTARALGGTGSFEDTTTLLGMAISISSWWTGLHDVVTTALGFLGVLDQRAYEDAMSTPGQWPHVLIWALMVAYLAWFIWTFVTAAAVAHRLALPRSIVAGLSGLAVYQLVFLLFNR